MTEMIALDYLDVFYKYLDVFSDCIDILKNCNMYIIKRRKPNGNTISFRDHKRIKKSLIFLKFNLIFH